MKITMLGVNSAFAKGEYAEVIKISDLKRCFDKAQTKVFVNFHNAAVESVEQEGISGIARNHTKAT